MCRGTLCGRSRSGTDIPSLQLWWSRRPLASSRAVLMALLLPDPCDEHCPEAIKNKVRGLLPKFGCGKGVTDQELRRGDPADASLRVSGTSLGAQTSGLPKNNLTGFFLRMRCQGTGRGRYGTGHIMRVRTGQCAWSTSPERREFAERVFSMDAASGSDCGFIATS